jgi:hypothetical protein
MNPPENPSSDDLKKILTEIRQLRQELAQTHRSVNRQRHARLGLVFALCLLFAGLGALGCYGYLHRHTYPAGIAITTETISSDSGEPVVAVRVTGKGNYKPKQTASDDNSRSTVTAYFSGRE